jgi:HSP20 family protein
MAIVHWFPIQEIETLQREMDQLFDSLSPVTTRSTGNVSPVREQSGDRVAFVPALEMVETSDAVYLKVEVPGLEAKDLDVQVTAEAAEISGERQADFQQDSHQTVRSEFRYGKFRRVIPMPVRIQQDKVEADYQNGILSLKLPKADAERNKVVKVNLG